MSDPAWILARRARARVAADGGLELAIEAAVAVALGLKVLRQFQETLLAAQRLEQGVEFEEAVAREAVPCCLGQKVERRGLISQQGVDAGDVVLGVMVMPERRRLARDLDEEPSRLMLFGLLDLP